MTSTRTLRKLLLVTLLAVVSTAYAGPAQAKPQRSASVSDPVGDVSYQPVEGFTPVGPAAWADLVGTEISVSRSGTLKLTVTLADQPDDLRDATGIFGVSGTVYLEGGRKKELVAWVLDDSVRTASVGSKSCKASGSISRPTATVTMKIRLGTCTEGITRITVVGTATEYGAKPGATEPEGTYLTPVYFDETAPMKVKLPARRR